MAHGFGRQIAFVQALCAVFARSATVFVDAFRFALATAHAGAAGSEGGRAHSRHGTSCEEIQSRQSCVLLCGFLVCVLSTTRFGVEERLENGLR